MESWKRWLGGGLAVLGVSSAFVWVVHSTQPELPRRRNVSGPAPVQHIDVSRAVDAFLSEPSLPERASDTHASELPGLIAFSSWARRVAELELPHDTRQLTLDQAFRLRDILGKRTQWSDAELRNAVGQPNSGALASRDEALRLSRMGCNALRTAFIEQLHRASPWGASFTEVSKTIEELSVETSGDQLRLLGRLRVALPKLIETLKGARSFTAELEEVTKTKAFRDLSTLVSNSPILRDSCSLDEGSLDTQLLLSDGAASSFLVETESGLAPSEELSDVNEAVGAFLDLELFGIPGPAECKLSSEVPFEWQPSALVEANKALRILPNQRLKDLARLHRFGRGSLMDKVTGALPRAACQKVAQLVCADLKRSRLAQSEPSGVGALRRRANSMVLASKALKDLAEQSAELGCSQSLGLLDAEQYARRLIVEGEAVARDSVSATLVRLGQFASNDEPDVLRERALEQLRLQRLEFGAVALGIVEPGLRFLEQSGAELSPTEQRWQIALGDIDRGRPANPSDAVDSGLFAFERLLAMFFVRNNEACELASSGSVSELMGKRAGVFYDFGRSLLASIAQRCGEKATGELAKR